MAIEVTDKIVDFECAECKAQVQFNLLAYFKEKLEDYGDVYNSDKEVINHIEDYEQCEYCNDYACLEEI